MMSPFQMDLPVLRYFIDTSVERVSKEFES
jgi:hypothetical protein